MRPRRLDCCGLNNYRSVPAGGWRHGRGSSCAPGRKQTGRGRGNVGGERRRVNPAVGLGMNGPSPRRSPQVERPMGPLGTTSAAAHGQTAPTLACLCGGQPGQMPMLITRRKAGALGGGVPPERGGFRQKSRHFWRNPLTVASQALPGLCAITIQPGRGVPPNCLRTGGTPPGRDELERARPLADGHGANCTWPGGQPREPRGWPRGDARAPHLGARRPQGPREPPVPVTGSAAPSRPGPARQLLNPTD
jgi:hypothetical protein